MGFGHRVYKNYDPRAAIVRKTAGELFENPKVDDPLFEIAQRLEEVALADGSSSSASCTRMWTSSTPASSVGRWASLTRMFTVLFALGRLPGLDRSVARDDQDPQTKIGRPRQVYVRAAERDYLPIGQR